MSFKYRCLFGFRSHFSKQFSPLKIQIVKSRDSSSYMNMWMTESKKIIEV